jgi:hypothetical protein
MSATKRVEVVLRSNRPDWGSVSSKDISACIQGKIGRYTGLRRIPGGSNTVAPELKAIVDDLKQLYSVLARKRASANPVEVDEKIRDLERKGIELATASPFDSLYLKELKSARAQSRKGPLTQIRPVRLATARRRTKSVGEELQTSTGDATPAKSFAKVCQLSDAFSTEFSEDHIHFVRWPIAPGIQPCLIEIKQRGGTVKLNDTLTVLPRSVPHREVLDPIYAAYLTLIGHEYQQDIAKRKGDPDIKSLAAKTYCEPPFMCAAQTQIRQRMFKTAEDHAASGLPASMRRLFDQFVEVAAEPCLWHPRHLARDLTRENWSKVWAILARWDEWELQKPPRWTDRLRQHCSDVKLSIDSRVVSRQKEALRKMCDSLDKLVGLRKGDLSQLRRLEQGALPKRTIIL